jgi:hypothetical protein
MCELSDDYVCPEFDYDAIVRLSAVGERSRARAFAQPEDQMLIYHRDWVVDEWLYTLLSPNGHMISKMFREIWLQTA